MFLTTRGLILRETNYKEADKILTVLTEAEGKITAKARGVLRTKSKLSAGIQLLCFSELTLFGHKGMWTVDEAASIECFRGLRDDISLLALASYIAEVLEAASDEDCPDPAVLRLGLNSLYALSSGLFPPTQVKAAFEFRLMCLSGYQPDLSVCGCCGRENMESAWLLPERGELYCGECRTPGSIEVDKTCLDALRHIVSAEPRRVFSFTVPAQELPKLERICESYALCELDRPFGSLDYYKKISGKI